MHQHAEGLVLGRRQPLAKPEVKQHGHVAQRGLARHEQVARVRVGVEEAVRQDIKDKEKDFEKLK